MWLCYEFTLTTPSLYYLICRKLLGHRKSIISQKKDTPQKRTAPKPPLKIDDEPPPQPRRQAPCPPTNVSRTCSKGESSKSLLSSDEETSRLLESGSRSMCKY